MRRIAIVFAVLLIVASCGDDEDGAEGEEATAEQPATTVVETTTTTEAVTTTTTTTTTIPVRIESENVIEVWATEFDDFHIEVIKGDLRSTSGANYREGSILALHEDWMELSPGLEIRVGLGGPPPPPDGPGGPARGGVELRGEFYPEGTVLIVDSAGGLIDQG